MLRCFIKLNFYTHFCLSMFSTCGYDELHVNILYLTAGISFTPHEVGQHLVNVYRNGSHIPNSPFNIYVGESEIGNASKVKVYGRGLTEGMANELNEFTVNTKDAGKTLHIRVST